MTVTPPPLTDPTALPGPLLVLSGGRDDLELRAFARPERPRDGVDAVSELAVLAAASGADAATLLIPSHLRDVSDGTVVASPVVATLVGRLDDGRLELEVAVVELDDAAPPGAPGPQVRRLLDPGLSPVGSLLCDAFSMGEFPVRLQEVAAVLTSWGHLVLAEPELPPVDHGRLGRARHRVHRLADELSRRHRPMALAGEARRPAAPANLPVGFVPACPL